MKKILKAMMALLFFLMALTGCQNNSDFYSEEAVNFKSDEKESVTHEPLSHNLIIGSGSGQFKATYDGDDMLYHLYENANVEVKVYELDDNKWNNINIIHFGTAQDDPVLRIVNGAMTSSVYYKSEGNNLHNIMEGLHRGIERFLGKRKR